MNAKPTLKIPSLPHCISASLGMAVLALGFCTTALSQNIEVPIGQQAERKWTMDRPVTGMSRNQVEEFFGRPLQSKNPVGDPPISSWVYEDFVVYFEYDHVIHTVLKYTPATAAKSQ